MQKCLDIVISLHFFLNYKIIDGREKTNADFHSSKIFCNLLINHVYNDYAFFVENHLLISQCLTSTCFSSIIEISNKYQTDDQSELRN